MAPELIRLHASNSISAVPAGKFIRSQARIGIPYICIALRTIYAAQEHPAQVRQIECRRPIAAAGSRANHAE